MAICGACRQRISAADARTAHEIKDDNGRLKEVLHHKCWYVRGKRKQMGPNERYGAPPTPYEESASRVTADDRAALAERQKQIEAQRALEPDSTEFRDWRDQQTMEV